MALLIGEIFRRNAASFPERAAASMGDAVLTYAELNAAGNAVGHALHEIGIRRGDRVVCWADTALEILPVFVGLAKLGAVFAPLNARLGVDEAREVLSLASASLLVADAAHAKEASLLARDEGIPLCRIGEGAGSGVDLTAAARELESDEEVSTSELVEADPHVIFFTSGSTGRPKGVVLSHRVNWLRGHQGVFIDEPERSVCMFPLFHMAAFTLALAAWQTGGEIAFVASPSADELLSAVERRRGNRLYCIPAVWARILAADAAAYDISSLTRIDTGTSATPPELLHALKKRFPVATLRVYYGSTEGGAGSALSDRDVLRKPGSVGLPVPGVELRLSAEGEVCLRGELLMDGYFDDPQATRASLVEGWYRTGDLGSLDDEGYLWITGRLREILRTGGESVAPGEVEAVLADHPAVAEVAVVGIPDPQWGEVICAVVVPKAGAELDLEGLQQHCEGRLARFKRPRRLELVESLPRTAATGQIQRTLLTERLATRQHP
ncbi:MAG: acyl--CoA ligase [Deltaproteobacteria bacterium]|nr:acyl--CoA ligase [Deltaproteobacteria bacterium]